MADNFERAMDKLQEQILQEARAYYSAKVVEEFYHPQNVGVIMGPDGYGSILGPCGDTMDIYLRLDGQRIVKAAFMTDGCGATIACGSMLTQMVENRSLEEAAVITPEDLIAALDGLPDEHTHCALLAVNTLREAIASRSLDKDAAPLGTPEDEDKTQQPLDMQ